MGFGVLEDHKLEHVPGTAVINDSANRHLVEGAQHAKGRHGEIVLVPQPSLDPNDPLNWPQWKKECIMCLVSMAALMSTAIYATILPSALILSEAFNVPLGTVSLASGAHTFAIGGITFVACACTQKFGKRPVFLFSSLGLTWTCIWAAAAQSWPSWFAARVFQGLFVSAFEIIVPSSVGDLYFVHERGKRLAIWNWCLSTGATLGSVIGGYISQGLNWRWNFGFAAIACGCLFILFFFFVPETCYIRDPKFNTDLTTEGNLERAVLASKEEKIAIERIERTAVPEKHSYLHTLRPWTGEIYDRSNFLWLVVRPVFCYLYPSVLWASFCYGWSVATLGLYGFVNAQIFISTYKFDAGKVGLVSLSPWILGMLTNVIAGPLIDWIATKLSRANKGVYEPEFRLPLLLPGLIIGAMGSFGFGMSIDAGDPWIAPTLFYGLSSGIGGVLVGLPVYSYVVDSFRPLAPEAFVCINFLKNSLNFGLSFGINQWVVNQGFSKTFQTVGGLQIAFTVPAFFLWIYGKRLRSWIARNRFLQRMTSHKDE